MADTDTTETNQAAAEAPKRTRRTGARKNAAKPAAAKAARTPRGGAKTSPAEKPAPKRRAAPKRATAGRKTTTRKAAAPGRAAAAGRDATVTGRQVAIGAGFLAAIAAGVAALFGRKKIAAAVAEHTGGDAPASDGAAETD